MERCPKCGNPLILDGGECLYCKNARESGIEKGPVVSKPPFAPVSSTGLHLEIVNGQVFCTDCSFINGDLVIPSVVKGEMVTGVAEKAFINCSELVSVTIPDTVTTIGSQAFYQCGKLCSITLGKSVKVIGK